MALVHKCGQCGLFYEKTYCCRICGRHICIKCLINRARPICLDCATKEYSEAYEQTWAAYSIGG